MEAHDQESKIKRDALRWLMMAGSCAVLLSLLIAGIDSMLGSWKREENLQKTLIEMRTAQYSLPTGNIDPRSR